MGSDDQRPEVEAMLKEQGKPSYEELEEALMDMVNQHCHVTEGTLGDGSAVFDTGALSANRDAFWLLVRAGKAEFAIEGYGRRWFCKLLWPEAGPMPDAAQQSAPTPEQVPNVPGCWYEYEFSECGYCGGGDMVKVRRPPPKPQDPAARYHFVQTSGCGCTLWGIC